MASYIPTKEAELSFWATNFKVRIVANPGLYGLVAADGVSIGSAVDDFNAKYALATNPITRTSLAIANKDASKVFMLDIVRPYAQTVLINRGVADADKLDLGLKLPDTTPTAIPAPNTSVILSFVGATQYQHTLRFSDQNTPDKRAKPKGTIGMQLWKFVGTAQPTSPAACNFHAFVTTQPFAVDFDPSDVGKTAWYYARWQNAKGEVGPWSNLLHFTIAGA